MEEFTKKRLGHLMGRFLLCKRRAQARTEEKNIQNFSNCESDLINYQLPDSFLI